MSKISKLFFLPIVILLPACATMNKSECLNADWQIIGLEDGAQGRLPAYIGNHRSACAQYGVTPDLTLYQQGHKQGLLQYCTKARGYQAGAEGDDYLGVCPADLEKDFLKGYELGLAIYNLEQEIRSVDYSISSRLREIESIEDKIEEKEEQLISDGVSKDGRRRLLEEVRELRGEIAGLEVEIVFYEKEKAVAEAELYQLTHR